MRLRAALPCFALNRLRRFRPAGGCRYRMEVRVTKLYEIDNGLLSQGVYDTVIKLRRIADSLERDGMKSSAGHMRRAVALIIELESKLRRKSDA